MLFVIILCDTHCLAMVHAVYTVRQRSYPKAPSLAALPQFTLPHPTVKSVIKMKPAGAVRNNAKRVAQHCYVALA